MNIISNVYQRLFENANAPIAIIDSDFKIVDCNDMVLEILNFNKNDLIGKSPDDPTISPKIQGNGKTSSELGQQYFTSAAKGKNKRFEWIHLKKDGSEIIVEVSLFSFGSNGDRYYFAVWRDLTEIKKQEIKLKEREERFEVLFSKATDSMILHSPDLDTGITHCNEAAYTILGYDSPEGLIGKSILDISPKYQAEGVKTAVISKKHIEDCLLNGQTSFEWIHLKHDETPIWLDIVLTKFSFDGEIYIHSVWRDITEKKNQETELENYKSRLEEMVEAKTEDLKRAQSQLIESEKMASLGILTSGVAHEINNPLNFIVGGYTGICNELKEQESIDLADIDIYLEGIKQGADRIKRIVKGLNQLSRNEEKHEECDIQSIMDNCLTILQSKFKRRIKIKKDYCDKTPKVKGNSGQLHQAFTNILSNAIDSITGRGTIEIQTICEDNSFHVVIKDTGHGINEEHLIKVKDPFFTTKAPGKGTGLGLSIADSIIRDHKGEINFESEIDRGTTATIRLPKYKYE